jgi:hypothetical protein
MSTEGKYQFRRLIRGIRIADCQLPIVNFSDDESALAQIGNWQSAIGNPLIEFPLHSP